MTERRGTSQPVLAGVISAAVGFSSSFVVVLAGLRAVGASADQAASGLSALCVAIGVGTVAIALRTRRPVALAWSTPGAALLATTATMEGGFSAAVGAFLIAGLLVAVTGFVPQVTALVQRVPSQVAAAMLAGVLFGLCVRPLQALPLNPLGIGAMLAAWAVAQRFAPRWAVPAALVAGLGSFLAAGSLADVPARAPLPHLLLVAPTFSLPAVLSIAVPLYLVTMTAQNLPGVAVMRTLEWPVPWRAAMAYTGAASAAGAVLGGHAINLAAITATLTAGPDAGPDRSRRWIAAVSAGASYLVLGAATPLVVAVAGAAPRDLVPAFAGIALFGAFANAVAQAMTDGHDRLAAAVTLLTAASGIQLAGLGPAFWALAIGSATAAVLRRRTAPAAG